jgi:hypothetical protein
MPARKTHSEQCIRACGLTDPGVHASGIMPSKLDLYGRHDIDGSPPMAVIGTERRRAAAATSPYRKADSPTFTARGHGLSQQVPIQHTWADKPSCPGLGAVSSPPNRRSSVWLQCQ